MRRTKSVYNMNIGEESKIISMDNIDKAVYHRFMDLGIAPNVNIKLLNKINFNQLYIVEVDDVEICIRQKDANNIIVEEVKRCDIY